MKNTRAFLAADGESEEEELLLLLLQEESPSTTYSVVEEEDDFDMATPEGRVPGRYLFTAETVKG